ncbi:GH25 family lysozyme [Lacticaseibacillus porcinae]|uniref:GH25 family lysozyme n=1 Tax=Lacticaseibacillus porcinae TaxID=1123687 RepID=UPI000F786AAA|nr:GH25 family lysozyme [Lacticaseibacillus porcinae]
MSTPLVADVSSWNPDTQSFFNSLAQKGVKAVIVKLTEGTTYTNPKAKAQIQAAWKAGMHAHGYHFARYQTAAQAKAEALYFVKAAKAVGLNGTSVLAADVEAAELPKSSLTSLTNTFLSTVKAAGYGKVDFYTMASWVKAGYLKPSQLIAKNMWIAAWNVSMPGIENVGTWQFTNNFQNLGVDMSYDFHGLYTKI